MIRQAMLAVAAVAALAGCSPAMAAQSSHRDSAAQVQARPVAAEAEVSAAAAVKPDQAEPAPWEYSVRNPQARGFAQGVVDCLHRKGVKYAEVNAKPDGDRITIGLGGPDNDRASITRGLQLIPQCEREVPAASSGKQAQKPATAVRPQVSALPAGAGQDSSPEPAPWEYNVRNPQARGFAQGVVDCLHRKGVKYAEVNAKPDGDRITIGLGGPDNDRASITRGLELIPKCEREVSAARR